MHKFSLGICKRLCYNGFIYSKIKWYYWKESVVFVFMFFLDLERRTSAYRATIASSRTPIASWRWWKIGWKTKKHCGNSTWQTHRNRGRKHGRRYEFTKMIQYGHIRQKSRNTKSLEIDLFLPNAFVTIGFLYDYVQFWDFSGNNYTLICKE